MTTIRLVGNYCHDTLIREDGTFEQLGSSAAYISSALHAAKTDFEVIAKVGGDFLYSSRLLKPAIVSKTHPTTSFLDNVTPGKSSSILKASCEPIYAHDIPTTRASIGLACGVANEILPETIEALRASVDILICDVQGLVRKTDADGRVRRVHLKETPFLPQLSLIDILKVNAFEAAALDLSALGKTTLLITEGPAGTRIISEGRETKVAPYPAKEIDATGAGDSFIAGLALGLTRGMKIEEAVKLGNRYGAFAVEAMGIPDFNLM